MGLGEMLERVNARMPSARQRNDARMLLVLVAPRGGGVQIGGEMAEFAQPVLVGQSAQVGFLRPKTHQRE